MRWRHSSAHMALGEICRWGMDWFTAVGGGTLIKTLVPWIMRAVAVYPRSKN